MIRSTTVGVLLVAIAVSQSATPCFAQQDGRRREFVQGLLKTFIDSQLPPETQTSRPTTVPHQQRPNQQQPRNPQQSVNRNATPKMREAAQLLANASSEMSLLVESLESDVYRADGVRQLLNLAFKVNGDAAVLSNRLNYATDIESLREPLRALDQNWHTLEYRLSQTRNLSASTIARIKKIQQFESQLATMFKLPTQVDLNALSARAIQMNQSLRTLLQDIDYEVNDANMADQLVQAGRDTYDQLQRFVRMTRPNPGIDVNYETLKREFLKLENQWASYQQTLRRANNRYVQRQTQRINDDMRTMHELMYVSNKQVSRKDLQYAGGILRSDLDLLMRRINLKMLSSLPASQRNVIEAASDLDGTCDDFNELLNDDLDNIRDMYLYMYNEWQRLSNSLRGISSPQAAQALRDVERSMGEMQAILGVKFDLDRKGALELAGQIINHARHMQADIRDFFGRPNRYARSFQNSSLDAVADFEATTRQLYTGMNDGEPLQMLKQRISAVTSSWQTLNQMMPQFSNDDQAHLRKIARELTPQLVQMQTLLAF